MPRVSMAGLVGIARASVDVVTNSFSSRKADLTRSARIGVTFPSESPAVHSPSLNEQNPEAGARRNLPSGFLAPWCNDQRHPHRSDQPPSARNPRCAFPVASRSFRLPGRDARAIFTDLYERDIQLRRELYPND